MQNMQIVKRLGEPWSRFAKGLKSRSPYSLVQVVVCIVIGPWYLFWSFSRSYYSRDDSSGRLRTGEWRLTRHVRLTAALYYAHREHIITKPAV